MLFEEMMRKEYNAGREDGVYSQLVVIAATAGSAEEFMKNDLALTRSFF